MILKTSREKPYVCQYCCMGTRQQVAMKYRLFFKSENEKERYQKQKS